MKALLLAVCVLTTMGAVFGYWDSERVIARGNGRLISCSESHANLGGSELMIKRVGEKYFWVSNNNAPLLRVDKSMDPEDVNVSHLVFINEYGEGQIFLSIIDQKHIVYKEYRRNTKNSFISYSGYLHKDSSLEKDSFSINGTGDLMKCVNKDSAISQDLLITLRGQDYFWASNKAKPLIMRSGKYNPPYNDSYTFLTNPNGDGFIRIKHTDKKFLEVHHGPDSFYEEFRFNEQGNLSHYRGGIIQEKL